MNELAIGDCRRIMRKWIADGVRVQTCVTSPPYWGLRDYGIEGQLGMERTITEYVANMVEVFGMVRELLADDGTLWLNLGDTYAGSRVPGLKPKDLCGISWRVAFALQADGWWLRQDIIWAKPNPMPESVTDRCTKSHEYLFLLAKSERYFYDAQAIKELGSNTAAWGKSPKDTANRDSRTTRGLAREECLSKVWEYRNRRDVWTIASEPYEGAHFACMPQALVEPCILAGSRPGDIVLDPFMGSGTVARVAQRLGRRYLGCELNPDYVRLASDRTRDTIGMAF